MEITLTKPQSEIFMDESRFKVIAAGRRFGKRLTLDTPLLTTEGWKTMGAVKEGDYVFGLDGKPTLVTFISEIAYDKKVYAVTFSDGSVIKADPEHEWYVESRRYRKQKGRGAKYDHIKTIYTTQEMVDEGVRIKRTDSKIESNFSIPVAAPLNLPIVELPFEPYSLGVWLGDGTSNGPEFCCDEQDYEIVENFVYETKEKKTAINKTNQYSFCGESRGQMKGILRDLGVLNNKHIPEQYLMASEIQRLFLLQGLMDTDGTVSKSGHCEYCGVNENLVRDVLRLVISLGIKATLSEGDAKLNGRVVGTKYRVKFTTDKPVFKLKRKLDRLIGRKKGDINKRFIVSIDEIPSEPMRCISVEAPDHLYLAGESLIATHNTILSIYSLVDAAAIPDSNVWYVTASYRACRMIAWEPLKEVLYGAGWVDKVNESDLSIKLKNRSKIILRGADNYDSLRGTSINRLVLDECAFLDQRVFTQALRPTLSDSGGGAIFISSPTGRDWFYDLWLKGQDGPHKEEGWKSWQYTTLEGGNVPKEEIEAARRDLDEKTFNQEYNAAFVDYHGLVYYNYDRVTSVRDHLYNKNRTLYIGLDFNVSPMVAVIAQKEGDDMFVIDEVVLYSSNTDEMADEIRSRYPVDQCIIYPDPASKQRKTSAGGKTDYSILQNYGFRVRVRNSHPFVRDRINAVNSRLKNSDDERHLFVSNKCRNLLESLEKMSYKPGTSIPEKGKYDHATDALGYMCLTGDTLIQTPSGPIPVESLKDGMLVNTVNGTTEVRGHSCSGVDEIYEVELEGGVIHCTGDHKFLTQRGFIEARNISSEDRLICSSFEKGGWGVKARFDSNESQESMTRKELFSYVLEHLSPERLAQGSVQVLSVSRTGLSSKVYNFNALGEGHYLIHVDGELVVTQNCEYLFPVRRTGGPISTMRLSGL